MRTCVFDWKGTLYRPGPEGRGELIEGAKDVLATLSAAGVALVLLGKDTTGTMPAAVNGLGVLAYFREIVFVNGAKQPSDFGRYVDQRCPAETVCIGDRTRSELLIAEKLGAIGLWVRDPRGRFADELPPEPAYQPGIVVPSLRQVVPVLQSLDMLEG